MEKRGYLTLQQRQKKLFVLIKEFILEFLFQQNSFFTKSSINYTFWLKY